MSWRYPYIACLCPTFGRPTLLRNALACFTHQAYPINRCCLIILDDLGTIQPHHSLDLLMSSSRVKLVSQKTRVPSITEKYNALVALAPPSDIYVVWEDDDVQLPWCLKEHAEACTYHGWSYPQEVWSDYPGKLVKEETGGRFHGSLGIRADFLKAVGGWPDTRRADFDQQLIANLNRRGPPGRPSPSYVFRWHTHQTHGQSMMRSPADTDWYDRYEPPDGSGPHQLFPQFDPDTIRIWQELQPEHATHNPLLPYRS